MCIRDRLYGVLTQKDADATGVLAALGFDVDQMQRGIKAQFDSRQMVRWHGDDRNKEEGRLDPALQQVLTLSLIHI